MFIHCQNVSSPGVLLFSFDHVLFDQG